MAEHDRHHEEEVVVVESPPPPPPVYVVQAPPRAAPPEPTPPPPPAFSPSAARASLEAVNLGTCRDGGAPLGYGHARVTFAPDGTVSRVTVDSPAGLNAAAVACIGGALGQASVPPFSGPAEEMPTPFYVR